jgi:hypothetical protein
MERNKQYQLKLSVVVSDFSLWPFFMLGRSRLKQFSTGNNTLVAPMNGKAISKW